MGYRDMGPIDNGTHEQWGTWAMGYRGNGVQGVWGAGGYGPIDNGTHGQWGIGVWGTWAIGYRSMGHMGNGVQGV